jgi:iron only hydrogenase large subunit-like protein
VAQTLKKILPARVGDMQALKIDGIPNCQKILEQAVAGDLKANFIEGMACLGGCVGGPGRIVGVELSTPAVQRYADEAVSATPVENRQIYQLLTQLGWNNPTDNLVKDSPADILLSRHIHKSIG